MLELSSNLLSLCLVAKFDKLVSHRPREKLNADLRRNDYEIKMVNDQPHVIFLVDQNSYCERCGSRDETKHHTLTIYGVNKTKCGIRSIIDSYFHKN